MTYIDQHPTAHGRFAAYLEGMPGEEYPGQASDQDNEGRVAVLREQIERAYGLEQSKLSNQMSIARMQSGNSRAATAAQAKAARQQLALAREEMNKIGIPDMLTRKFVAEKNYEIAKLSAGIEIAQVATQLRSTPDRYFMARDFESMIPGLMSQSLSAPTEMPTEGPQPQSLEGLVAELSPSSGAAGGGAQAGGAPSGDNAQQQQQHQMNALQELLKANPPSTQPGLSSQDQNFLNIASQVFKQGLNPFVLDKMNPTQKGMLMGAGARGGYHPETELWRAETRRPGLGNPLQAG